MTLFGWLVWGYLAVGFVLAWRFVFHLWYEDFKPLGGGDLAMGIVMATILGAMGAAVAMPFLFVRLVFRGAGLDADDIGRVLAGESREDKLMRREREVRERERAVERLEREVLS